MRRRRNAPFRRALLCAVVFVCAACASAGNTPAPVLCQTDAECPAGQVCRGGQCGEPGPPTDGGEPDGGVLDGGPDDGGADGGERDAAPPLAGFGERCGSHGDCQSQICLQTGRSSVCTRTCADDCPQDFVCKAYVLERDRIANLCVPFGDVYCVPCSASTECPKVEDRCTDLSGATYCTRGCEGTNACPPGHECRDVPFSQTAEARLPTLDGGSDGGPEPVYRQCVPLLGKCPGCIDRDGDGYGVGAECRGPDCDDSDPAVHPGAVEICDGRDNNCDDRADEPFDLTSDDLNCGACGAGCDVGRGQRCCGGTCVEIATSSEHCGGCGHPCAGPGVACCAGMCRDTLAEPAHCGGCDRACTNDHGEVACDQGACTPVCAQGFGDCDANPRNGCETSLTTLEACGACGTVCRNPHGPTACVGGACAPACELGWGNCDGSDDNGCETDLFTTAAHCGRCNQKCENAHGLTSCDQGTCKPVCELNWDDCDGDPRNGCETDLSQSVQSCGGCRLLCTNDHGTTRCQGGVCAPTCDPGFQDCDRNPRNGCESDIQTSTLHCGGCDRPCTNSHGQVRCVSGVCAPTCDPGYADCDANPANGCETHLLSSVLHCGGCNAPCTNAHGGTQCAQSACLPSCDSGWGDCDGNPRNGCETDLVNTTLHCGGCGLPCVNPNGTTVCEGGSCRPACAAGFFDCNGNPRDGCEARLSDVTTCNACAQDAECPAGFYCAPGNVCTKKKPRGDDCIQDNECTSGFCTDGVCCDGECDGLCRSCKLSGARGSCTFVPTGQDPDGECEPQELMTCGRDGTCDGAGGCRLWAPGTPCQGQSCASGIQTNPRFCDGFGNCPEAIPATTLCAPYVCNGTTSCFTGCGTDAQCAQGYTCAAGICRVAQGQPCNGPADCANGHCVDGVCCDGPCNQKCEKCNLPGSIGLCAAIPAGSDPDNECATADVSTCGQTGACSGTRGSCQLYSAGTICQPQSCAGGVQTNTRTCDGSGVCTTPTPATVSCFPYVCNATTQSCFASCASDAECVAGYGCAAGGVCKKKDGESCQGDTECKSGFCTDGVCCASRCGGTCEKCNQQGRLGSCDPLPVGTDPDGECAFQDASTCGRTGECSGDRSCALYAAGTVCAAAFCAGNTSNLADTCNGLGTCVDSGTRECAPYTCNGTTGLCRQSCAGPGDCVAGYECSGGACKKTLGQPCGTGAECATAACADGVCCQSACAGVCEKCNQAGRAGYCDPIPAGADPDSECGQDLASTCQRNGFCSGARTCALYSSGTICNPAFCTGNTSSLADLCDGTGTCVDQGTRNCFPYVCDPTNGLCKATCASSSDCQSGYECVGGQCKKSRGQTCNLGSECASGFCADSVCCESACGGVCEKCNQAGRIGFCDPVPVNQDPDNECATDPASTCDRTGVCSGNRSCQIYATGTMCQAASCATATSSNRADTCDGVGGCVDNGVQNCFPYLCNTGTGACRTSCASSSDCAAGYSCKTTTGQCLKNDGQTCSLSSECLNNACCGGFCRNLQTDPSNCGACFSVCQTNAGTASNTCVSGACSPVCNATWFNVDANNNNGCECRQDTIEITGNYNLTPGDEEIDDCGGQRDVDANIIPTSDNDFYYAWVTDTLFCNFNLVVDLYNIPAATDYDLYVYRWDGANWNLIGYSINGSNNNEEVVYGGDSFADDTAWYGFEVRRYSGPAACGLYHLRVKNGS